MPTRFVVFVKGTINLSLVGNSNKKKFIYSRNLIITNSCVTLKKEIVK